MALKVTVPMFIFFTHLSFTQFSVLQLILQHVLQYFSLNVLLYYSFIYL